MKTTKLILWLTSILLLAACSEKEMEPAYFNIDATEVTMPDSQAGSTDVLLATNCNPSVTVEESAAEWLSATITPRCLTLTCTENIAPEARSGKALILAGTSQISVTVTQPGHVDEEQPEDPDEGDPDDPDQPVTSYELYDVYYENGKAAGIVFWASEDHQSALVVSLDRSEMVPWSYDGTRTIGTGNSDGAANTELLRASEEAADIPALAFCDQHGAGWYWPSLSELQTLFEAYNGTSYEEATRTVPADITDEEKAARASFDKLLTDNGGTAMNLAGETENGDAYWSSTEQTYKEVTYGSSFRFGKAYASGGGDMQVKTKSSRYIRCIKAVSVGGSETPEDPDDPVETKFPVYRENGEAVGIIYWTSEDGKTSKVLSLKRVEAPWSYNGANILGATSTDDGAANTAVLKASVEVADIPALELCNSLGDDWYWPSINELVEIFGIYNGIPYADAADENGKYHVPDEITDAEKEARAAFDLSLTTYGGDAMNTAAPTENGNRYWSSTEYVTEAGDKAYGSFMVFGKAYMSVLADQAGKTNASGGRYVRCIRIINNN